MADERPVDPGCLPAWSVGELPPPRPRAPRSLLALVGPGVVAAGGAIGSGEWVLGAQIGARYHGAMLWVALVAIAAQAAFNTEAMRYTIATGEPILVGFLRTRPGPRFWVIVYLLLDVGTWLPASAALSAEVLLAALGGTSDHGHRVAALVLVGCATTLLFGRRVYDALSVVLTTKVLLVLGYLVACGLFLVQLETWAEIWSGLVDPTRRPPGGGPLDWGLIAALAGYAGTGGLGNTMVSNYVRDKGWGMGAAVGAIPAAIGGRDVALAHLGTMARADAQGVSRFRGWMKIVARDQYLGWAGAALLAMVLSAMLGRQYLRPDAVHATGDAAWAIALARDVGAAEGALLGALTLACSLAIFLPGQVFGIDVLARRWTDALWSAHRSVRRLDPRRAGAVYYLFVAGYVAVGLGALLLLPAVPASVMLLVGGNLANLALAVSMLHTLYVNHRFLPPPLRPSGRKTALVAAGALFYVAMFALVVEDKVLPFLVGP